MTRSFQLPLAIACVLMMMYLFYLHQNMVHRSTSADTCPTVWSVQENSGGEQARRQHSDVAVYRFTAAECMEKMTRVGGSIKNNYYGSWMVCLSGFNRSTTGRGPVIYSFGLGDEINFEEQLLEILPTARIYAFDPTPDSIVHVQKRLKSNPNMKYIFTILMIHEMGWALRASMDADDFIYHV